MAIDKLSLRGYADEKFAGDPVAEYKVFLNPDTIVLNNSNTYSKNEPLGAAKESTQFNRAGKGTLSFSLMLDGTRTIGGKSIEVAEEIAKMESLVLAYKSKSGGPNFVQVLWGKIDFKGRLTSFNVNYTMFRPDGAPLRAKVDLAFASEDGTTAQEAKTEAANDKKAQKIVVKAGDTLPQLCQTVYGSPGNYMQVVRENSLVSFIRLKPGLELVFPPIA